MQKEKRKKKELRSEFFQIRLTPAEKKHIKKVAKKNNVPVSKMIRKAVFDEVAKLNDWV